MGVSAGCRTSETSDEREASLKPSAGSLLPRGNSPQFSLDGAGAAEQPAVHLIEAIVGCVEHEAAGNADSYADRAAVELDCKTLGNHEDSTPGEHRQAARVGAAQVSDLLV